MVLLFTYFEGFCLDGIEGGESWLLLPSYDVALLSMSGTIKNLFFCSMFDHVLFVERT